MDAKDYPEFVTGITSTINDVAKTRIDLLAFLELIAASLVADVMKRNMFYAKKPDVEYGRKAANTLMALGIRVQDRGFGNEFVEGSDLKMDTTNKAKVDLLHGLLGMLSEAGELASILIDFITSDKVDLDNLLEEMGDFRFYFQLALNSANELDPEKRFTADQVKLANMAKLRVRYATDEAVGVHSGGDRDYAAEKQAMSEALSNADVSSVS